MAVLNVRKVMETHCHIINKEKKDQVLIFNSAQEELYEEIRRCKKEKKPAYFLILKARQLGMSTFTENFGMTLNVMYPNQSMFIMTQEQDASDQLYSMSHYTYENFPNWLKGNASIVKDNQSMMLLSNGSKLQVMVASANAKGTGRGQTFTYAHLSEFDWWGGNVMQTLNGVLSACTEDAIVIIETTANGCGNFKKLWDRAVERKNNGQETLWNPIFFAWFQDNKYESDYYEEIKLDKEEKQLIEIFKKDKHTKDMPYEQWIRKLIWRRRKIELACNGDTNLFHQEFPSCITYETRIGTDKGLIKIGEAECAKEATYGKIKRYIKNPQNQIYKLKTLDGYELRGTYEHPIFVNDKECVDLGSLKEGDLIQMSKPMLSKEYYKYEWEELGVKNSITIDEKWGKFLGYFMGDGSYSCDCLSIACGAQDEDVVQDVLKNIKDVFGLEAHTRLIGKNKGCKEVRINCKGLKDIFKRLGIVKSCPSDQRIRRDIKVPECIFRSPESVVRAFISSLFESDGFNDYRNLRIVFFSKEKQFVNDVQLLLLALGVMSKNTSHLRTNGSGYTYMSNELILNGFRAYEFNQKIGFVGKRKRSKSHAPKLTQRATSNDFVTKVTSVEKDGFENTYNLTIDEIHEFDANGIHTHNCPEEAFISSGQCIFDLNSINKRKADLNEANLANLGRFDKGYFLYKIKYDEYSHQRKPYDIKWKSDNINGYITLFKGVKHRHPYVLAIDPAGDGSDYTAINVLDNRSCEQVCTLHMQNMSTLEIACQAYAIGQYYNNALIASETNFAPEVMSTLLELGYDNLYVMQADGNDMNQSNKKRFGFKTTQITRPYIISFLVEYVNKSSNLINSYATLIEAENFVRVVKTIDGRTKDKAQANAGQHDDLLMSLGIALYIRDSGQQTFDLLEETQYDIYDPEMIRFRQLFGEDDLNNNGGDYLPYDDIQ